MRNPQGIKRRRAWWAIFVWMGLAHGLLPFAMARQVGGTDSLLVPSDLGEIDYESWVADQGLLGEVREPDPDGSLEDEACLGGRCPARTPMAFFRMGTDLTFQPGRTPAAPLGSLPSAWTALQLQPMPSLTLDVSLKKDSFEPVYAKAGRAWWLSESKRAALTYAGTRFRLVAGDFRVLHGKGHLNGRGWAPIESVSSPSRISRAGAGIAANPSNMTIPSRRGIAGQFQTGQHFLAGWYGYSTLLTSSFIAVDVDSTGAPQTHIPDVSSTYRFTSEASVQRRHTLTAVGYGALLAWSAPSVYTSVNVERAAFESRFPVLFDSRQTGVSTYSRLQRGAFAMAGEAVWLNGDLSIVDLEAGWTSEAAGALKATYRSHRTPKRSVFGQESGLIGPKSTLLGLSYRSRSERTGTFSLSAIGLVSSDNTSNEGNRRFVATLFLEPHKRNNLRFQFVLRHSIRKDEGPVGILQPGIEGDRPKQTTQLHIKGTWDFSPSGSIKGAILNVRERENRLSFTLFSARMQYAIGHFDLRGVMAIGYQRAHDSNRMTGYYSDSGLMGRIPVSSLSGSGSATTISVRYRNGHNSLEFRFRESVRPHNEANSAYYSRQVQLQFTRGF